ncbi:MAG TPA: excinuclease ABC subunit C, partial [Deltaproteobacteria bacterium]|nr:excinuclease ABC subunit C [Deltaproteobacteria bacterium]
MQGKHGEVLYVGKAKNLKARVTSYFNRSAKSAKTTILVSHIYNFDFILTNSEAESLVLENNLIKKHKPKYNILLKDDKSFPYIFISNHEFPRIERHRGAKNKPGKYFGPFASSLAVNSAIKTLQRIFLLRSCTDKQ